MLRFKFLKFLEHYLKEGSLTIIEYPNIFKVNFNRNAFTAFLIDKTGHMLTVAHRLKAKKMWAKS
jgi:GTP-dependent phosphoenolpyruvate carboxykinase